MKEPTSFKILNLFLMLGDNTKPSQNSIVHYQPQKNWEDTYFFLQGSSKLLHPPF